MNMAFTFFILIYLESVIEFNECLQNVGIFASFEIMKMWTITHDTKKVQFLNLKIHNLGDLCKSWII